MTGSGKTYTIANLIANVNRPTLVLSPNKTLAAQLFSEFKAFFPENAVEYFVSYYDYYQPEAYIPQSDTYIEKDALDQRRDRPHAPLGHPLAAGAARRGGGGLGLLHLRHRRPRDLPGHAPGAAARASAIDRDAIIRRLIAVQYERNDYDFHRGTFRVRGDVVEVFPANEESLGHPDRAVRRHDRRHPPDRSAARAQVQERLDADPRLPGQPLRDAGRAARARARDRAGGAGRAADLPARAQSPAGGAAARAAHAVRHGDAARARLLPRHRELLAPPHRPPPGRGAADADRVPAARTR